MQWRLQGQPPLEASSKSSHPHLLESFNHIVYRERWWFTEIIFNTVENLNHRQRYYNLY